ncbi:MAG: hypothetical protein PW734_00300 [Verrucomicrobium sp.]|nr:hypothetical protein [Verrucomicrobium sp.]
MASSLAAVEAQVRQAWCRETTYYKETWTPDNPAAGHCAVTAAWVQEKLGGEIAHVLIDDRGFHDSHFFNILPDGRRADLTRGQFSPDVRFDPPLSASNEELLAATAAMLRQEKFEGSAREFILSYPATKARYDLLKARCEAAPPADFRRAREVAPLPGDAAPDLSRKTK